MRAQLDEASALLDVVFARAPVGLAFFDEELRFVRVNDRLAAMNGVPVSEHLGRRVREVLPGLPAGVEDDLGRVLETGQPLIEVEVSGHTPATEGTRREWLTSYWPVRPAGGDAITGIGAVVFDVTDRRIARRAIRAQADRYEALLLALSEAGEGMVVLEEGGHCVYANAAFEQISGYTFPELAALDSLLELTGPLEHDGVGTLLLHRRDGAVVEVEAAGVPLESDRERHLVVLVRDVTERRRAEAERERLLARAAVSAHAAEVLGQAGDEAHTIDRLTRLCVRELCDTCLVVVGDGPGAVRKADVACRDPERERALVELQLRFPLDEAPHRAIAAVLHDGVGRVLENVRDAELREVATGERHLELLRQLDVGTAVLVPLRARGAVRGVLAGGIASRDPGDRDFLRAALEDVSRVAAPALEAARLYDERRAMSRTLQRSLLPPNLPDIPGVQIAARHAAGGEGADIGGDFYDCFPSGDGEWGVAIGDVSGRGAEAAAVTTLARCTLRATVLRESRPDAVLRELNDAVLGQGGEFRFCTALYLALTVSSDGGADVRVAAGGHPLPLLLHPSGDVETVGRPGTLLGVLPDPAIHESAVHLDPGDCLVLFTDGVIEASPLDDALGPERLASFLGTCAGQDAATIAAGVERRTLEVQHGRLRDDVAVVVLRAV